MKKAKSKISASKTKPVVKAVVKAKVPVAPKKSAPKVVAKPLAPKPKTVAKKEAPKTVVPAPKITPVKAKTPEKKVAPPVSTKTTPKTEPPKPSPVSTKTLTPMKAMPILDIPKEKPEKVEVKVRQKLKKEDLKFFENLLNDRKETLIQELGYLEDNSMRLNSKDGSGDLSSHAYHLADHATETQDREQAFHMASREGRYLFYIEEALDRVRAGTYGVCKKCGNIILKARLEAVPTAKMCIVCKSKQENSVLADAES